MSDGFLFSNFIRGNYESQHKLRYLSWALSVYIVTDQTDTVTEIGHCHIHCRYFVFYRDQTYLKITAISTERPSHQINSNIKGMNSVFLQNICENWFKIRADILAILSTIYLLG